jgi:hypothetical protein
MPISDPLPPDPRQRVASDTIKTAAALDDLDAAVRLIQAELGQTEGDIAAAFFSDEGADAWAGADRAERARILEDYVAFEGAFA